MPRRSKKSTPKTPERKRRINQIRGWIAQLKGRPEMVAELVEQYGIGESMAYRDIRHAYEQLELESVEDRPIRKARIRKSLERLYEKALNKGELQVALNTAKELIKVDGLAEAERIKIEQLYQLEVEQMDSETLKKELNEVMASMGVKA